MLNKRGDALEKLDECDLLVIPSCSTINKDGKLDMGRGIVKDIGRVWENLDRFFGEKIANVCGSNGLFWYARHDTLPIALLQVKTAYFKANDPSIAEQGLWSIKRLAEDSPDMTIYIILPRSVITPSVERYMENIPDNVVRWY
jgi:hypothetical protein